MKNYVKKFFSNPSGEVVIAQPANWPMKLAFGLYVIKYLASGVFSQVADVGFRVSLMYWAVLEVRSGESPFRRVLGMVVLVWMISGLWKLFVG